MTQSSCMRKIIVEELVRRFRKAGAACTLLDAARAAIAHGEMVEVVSVEQRNIIGVLTTADEVNALERSLRARAAATDDSAFAYRGESQVLRDPASLANG